MSCHLRRKIHSSDLPQSKSPARARPLDWDELQVAGINFPTPVYRRSTIMSTPPRNYMPSGNNLLRRLLRFFHAPKHWLRAV